MTESIRSASTDLLTWATSAKLLATPCEQWPTFEPPDKKQRRTKEQLRYELARRYYTANMAAARIIRNDPVRYAGVMQEWAQHFTRPQRWSHAA